MEKHIGRFNRNWKSEPSATREEMTREDAIREERLVGRLAFLAECGAQMQTNIQSSFGANPSTRTNLAQWHKGGIPRFPRPLVLKH